MDPERRAVLRSLAQFALVALPHPRIFLGPSRFDIQPLAAQARRVIDALAYLGEPFSDASLQRFHAAENTSDGSAMLAAIESVFAERCLVEVRINPEGRVAVDRGRAEGRLVEQGWRAFLVKVRNESGTTGRLAIR